MKKGNKICLEIILRASKKDKYLFNKVSSLLVVDWIKYWPSMEYYFYEKFSNLIK